MLAHFRSHAKVVMLFVEGPTKPCGRVDVAEPPVMVAGLFKEALALFQKVDSKHGMGESLAGLAGVAATSQSLDGAQRAARLFGSSEALIESLGIARASNEERTYQHGVAAAHAQLDEST